MEINHLPRVLARHSEYALLLSELQALWIRVTFTATQRGETKTAQFKYFTFEGKAYVNISAMLFSLFDTEDDDFDYTESTVYRQNNSNRLGQLKIEIQDMDTVHTFYHTVVNAVYQSGESVEPMHNGEHRIGKAKGMPIFLGYPMSTMQYSSGGIERILNTNGCNFREDFSSIVHIQVQTPNGQTIEANSELNFTITNEASANGVYIVTFTDSDGRKETKQFSVINAGQPSGDPAGTTVKYEQLGINEYLTEPKFKFKKTSGRNIIKVKPFFENRDVVKRWRIEILPPNSTEENRDIGGWYSDVDMSPYYGNNSLGSSHKPEEEGTYEIRVFVETKDEYSYYKTFYFEIEEMDLEDTVDYISLTDETGVPRAISVNETLALSRDKVVTVRPFYSYPHVQRIDMTITYPDGHVREEVFVGDDRYFKKIPLYEDQSQVQLGTHKAEAFYKAYEDKPVKIRKYFTIV
ncbi:hypothetical protein ACF3OB_01150 [Capnocytophaga canis]|uniref:hypothetical protein n=1 Tax=Capnocytophaga canis TaxID=1848903 RepID=UPI00370D61AA